MENIIWGIVLLLLSVPTIWYGTRVRKNAHENYRSDVRRYTANTTLKVVEIEKSIFETWEDDDDGNSVRRTNTFYLPTYEYTVDGKTYRYQSRQSLGSMKEMGRLITGYYDPANPSDVTENKPRRPIVSGFLFFALAAVMLFFAFSLFTGTVYVS